MITKYPIIGKHNRKYKVKFKDNGKDYLKLVLYKRILFIDFPLMHTIVNRGISLSTVNFQRQTEQIVEMYEYKLGYYNNIPQSLVNFKEWDGNMKS